MDKTPIANNALALIRSLGRVSARVPEYASFARRVCQSVPCAQRASALLGENGCTPLSIRGRDALESLSRAYDAFLTLSTPTKDSLRGLNDAVEHVEELLGVSAEGMLVNWNSQPDLLRQKDAEGFLAFHSELVLALCFTAASHFGLEPLFALRGLRLGDAETSFENLAAAREGLLAAVTDLYALGSWVIDRTQKGDGFFEESSGYCFSMLSEDVSEIVSGGDYRRISSTLFVGEPGSRHAIVGAGYIIGTGYKESFKLRDERAHGRLPRHAFDADRFDFMDPLGSIARCFAGDNAFCIHPEDLALALDRGKGGEA